MPTITIMHQFRKHGTRKVVKVPVCPDCRGVGFILVRRVDTQQRRRMPCLRCKGAA